MLFHLNRVVRFINIHHLSTLSSMSCTYTPWVYVHIYICMMKYWYMFTLRLIYINFDHQRCLVYLKTISLIIGYIRIALSILPILIDSLSTTLPISYICVYIHTYMDIHICILSIHLVLWRAWFYSYTHVYDYIVAHIYIYREIMLFIGKPKGRSMMISNATNPLKESRKNLYQWGVRVVHPFVCGWFVILLWCVYKLLVTVP